jgi:hypothetical protein
VDEVIEVEMIVGYDVHDDDDDDDWYYLFVLNDIWVRNKCQDHLVVEYY